MSDPGQLDVTVTMNPDGTIFFTEVANETGGAVAFDEKTRQFVAYQGGYVYQITAVDCTFAVPAISFPDGKPDNISWVSLSDTVVEIHNTNDAVEAVQKVTFVMHPKGLLGSIDPTILNNPLPPPGGETVRVRESAFTAVVSEY